MQHKLLGVTASARDSASVDTAAGVALRCALLLACAALSSGGTSLALCSSGLLKGSAWPVGITVWSNGASCVAELGGSVVVLRESVSSCFDMRCWPPALEPRP